MAGTVASGRPIDDLETLPNERTIGVGICGAGSFVRKMHLPKEPWDEPLRRESNQSR